MRGYGKKPRNQPGGASNGSTIHPSGFLTICVGVENPRKTRRIARLERPTPRTVNVSVGKDYRFDERGGRCSLENNELETGTMNATSSRLSPDPLREKPRKQRAIPMRRYLVIALAVVALVIAAPSAFATRVIFDPPSSNVLSQLTPTTNCTLGSYPNNYTPCVVSQRNTPYTVEFVDCSTLSGLNPSATGWCLFLTNVTGGSLNTFTFQFTVPTPSSSYDGSNQLLCGSQPPGYATNNCQDGATVTAGDSLDLTFFAPLANNNNFYLITDFEYQPDPATVTVSAPEPGELGMFGLGLLALGLVYGWRKRRQARGGDLGA